VSAPPRSDPRPDARSDGDAVPEPAAVVVLGADAFLAALPATPAQLVEACLAAGFAAAVPASWGDEVIAGAALRELARRGAEPSILAVCPHVVERLLSAGPDLERWMIPLVPPPVAAARYVRALYGGVPVRVTYAGGCSSGIGGEVDERLLPSQLLAMLAARGIDPAAIPAGAAAPPSHRRFRSLPGGAPTPELLFAEGGRALVEMEEDDVTEALAQRLIAREGALFDLAPRLGCACSGAVPDCAPTAARAAVAALEPPRARDEVLDPTLAVDAARALPRRPSPAHVLTPPEAHPAYRRGAADPILADRPATPDPRRRFRTSGIMRAVVGAMPARRGEGRPLPRAYRGLRQRLTTGRLWAVTPREPTTAEREVRRAVQLADAAADGAPRRPSPTLVVPMPRDEPYIVPPPPPDTAARIRVALGALLVVAAALMWLL
jgi:hypothetical protein